MAQWYYRIDGLEVGPIVASELKKLAASGRLSPTDLIWKEGFQAWVPASRLKGLFLNQSSTDSTATEADDSSVGDTDGSKTAGPSVGKWASGLLDGLRKCWQCGESIGLLSMSGHCENCEKSAEEAKSNMEELRKEEHEMGRNREAELLRDFAARRRHMAVEATLRLKKRISSGQPVVLYRSQYLDVDSTVVNETPGRFDIAAIQRFGLNGWRVVGIVPRTSGIALSNTSFGSTFGETWGAGLGGNVIGVHVLLSLELKSGAYSDNEILEFVQEHFEVLKDSLSNGDSSDVC